jgi:nuclear pore complex protein Nup155
MTQRPADADATEALLKLASKTVDDQLGREQKYPELSDFFNIDFSASYAASDPRQQILRRKRAISLPDKLFEQYNCESMFSGSCQHAPVLKRTTY